MKPKNQEQLKKAFKSLLKNRKDSGKAYKFIVNWVEQKAKVLIRHKKIRVPEIEVFFEDVVGNTIENLVSYAATNPAGFNEIEDFEGYVFLVCRNAIYDLEVNYLNREFLNFRLVVNEVLNNLEKSGSLASLNNRMGKDLHLPAFTSADEIYSELSRLSMNEFNEIKRIKSTLWTQAKKALLAAAVLRFFESSNKTAIRNDLCIAFGRALGIEVLEEERLDAPANLDLEGSYVISLYGKAPDKNPSPPEQVIHKEFLHQVEQTLKNGLDALSEIERRVYILYYTDKYSLKEISRMAGFARPQNVDYYISKNKLSATFTEIKRLFDELAEDSNDPGGLFETIKEDLKEIFNKILSDYGYDENI